MLPRAACADVVLERAAGNAHPSSHTHRLWSLATSNTHTRKWGFWVHRTEQDKDDPTRYWTRWENYRTTANVQGRDDQCPGVGG